MELPQELQIELLLNLTPTEIIRYCQTNKEAYRICQSEYFWNQKALRDLKLPIISPPMTKYLILDELKYGYPEILMNFLIKHGTIDQVKDQLDEFIEGALIKDGEFTQELKEFLNIAIYYGKEETLSVLLEYILKKLGRSKTSELNQSLLDAISENQDGMIKMLEPHADFSQEEIESLSNDPFVSPRIKRYFGL